MTTVKTAEAGEWRPDVCVYHADCDDGFGAAWAIMERWPDDCRFVPASYGRLPDYGCRVEGRNILFVDFSLRRRDLFDLAERARSVFVIDHHASAEQELRTISLDVENDEIPFPLGIAADFERMRPGLQILAWFRSDMSGAAMAWRFAHAGRPAPIMIDLIEDRDLWRFRYGEMTHRHHAALGTYPRKFLVWDELSGRTNDLIAEGEHILRANREHVRSIVEETYFSSVGGHSVPTVNCPGRFASDVCSRLLALHSEAPFAASWYRSADGAEMWSLRSENSRADVSEIARGYGGGGHRNASGFTKHPAVLMDESGPS